MRFGTFTLVHIYTGVIRIMTQTISVGTPRRHKTNPLVSTGYASVPFGILNRRTEKQQRNWTTQPLLNRDGIDNIFVPHIKTIVFKCRLLRNVTDNIRIVVPYIHFISDFHLETDHAEQETSLVMSAHGKNKRSPKQKMVNSIRINN
jgi:hypothetical protein